MSDAEQFVSRFSEMWRAPKPDTFAALWHEDGELLHPGMESPISSAEIPDYVRRVKAAAPDVSLHVHRWAAAEDFVLIEWTITATVNEEAVEWSGVDRFTLRGDRAVYGVAYFDTLPLWARLDPSMERSGGLEVATTEAGAPGAPAAGN
jgi:ketosteroid isomerase-like protein